MVQMIQTLHMLVHIGHAVGSDLYVNLTTMDYNREAVSWNPQAPKHVLTDRKENIHNFTHKIIVYLDL